MPSATNSAETSRRPRRRRHGTNQNNPALATNGTLLPGQIEAESARLSELHGGLLFTAVEMEELGRYAEEGGVHFGEQLAVLPTLQFPQICWAGTRSPSSQICTSVIGFTQPIPAALCANKWLLYQMRPDQDCEQSPSTAASA